jgi:ribonucleoside-diphosphate reductase alpha chain
VGNADYPTEKITENSRRFRELGIGYANLGALLMAQGLPYDSDQGRAWAAAITALMTGHAYATSARTAARMGPFAGYHENAEPMLDVLRMHRDAVADIDEELVPTELLSAAQEAWDSPWSWASSTACATHRPACWRPPAPSACSWTATPPGSSPTSAWSRPRSWSAGAPCRSSTRRCRGR